MFFYCKLVKLKTNLNTQFLASRNRSCAFPLDEDPIALWVAVVLALNLKNLTSWESPGALPALPLLCLAVKKQI